MPFEDMSGSYEEFREGRMTAEDFREAVRQHAELDLLRSLFLSCLSRDDDVQIAPPKKALARSVFFHADVPEIVILSQDFIRANTDEVGASIETLNLGIIPSRMSFLQEIPGHFVIGFARSIISLGKFKIPSPFSEKDLCCNKGFAFEVDGKPYIFYYFDDTSPFFLIINPNMGNIVGCFFPVENIVIGQEIGYRRIVSHFKALCVTHKAAVRRYLFAVTETKPTLLVGFMHHVGHFILNELSGLDMAFSTVEGTGRRDALIGPHDYLDFRGMFKERGRCIEPDLTKSGGLFKHCLKHDVLPVRPTLRSYMIFDHFRDRIQRWLRRDRGNLAVRRAIWRLRNSTSSLSLASEEISDPVEVTGRYPILWIEVRNNDRIWLNQIEGIKHIIDKIAEDHPKAVIFIAGWSQTPSPTDEDLEMIEKDKALVTLFADHAAGRITVVDGVGLTARSKLAWAFACHAAVIIFGSGMTFPCLIANRPSVLHANHFYTHKSAMAEDPEKRKVFAESLTPYRVIPARHITDGPESDRHSIRGHYVDGHIIYQTLKDVLSADAVHGQSMLRRRDDIVMAASGPKNS